MVDLATITEEELNGLDDKIIDKIYSRVIDPRDVSLRKYCPHKPWPKQQLFLDLDCREAFFGGAAGPGKSDALLMCALQYVHVPQFSALILRRDYARLSLPGSIMDRARSWLYSTDATWNGEAKAFRFPSGATIQFGYIDQKEDRFRYASSEFQCLARGERIVMGDGSLRAIERVAKGDYVMTLEGPKSVKNVFCPRSEECVRVSHSEGSHVCSVTHKMFNGLDWQSYPCGSTSIQLAVADKFSVQAYVRSCDHAQDLGTSLIRPWRMRSPYRSLACTSHYVAMIALSGDAGISIGESNGLHQETWQHHVLSFRQGRVSLGFQTDSHGSFWRYHPRAASCASLVQQRVLDCPGSYLTYCGLCGALPHHVSMGDRACPPLLACAVPPCQLKASQDDGSVDTQQCSHLLERYTHPYTKRTRSSFVAFRSLPCSVEPVGTREVFDITVEGANHYISECGLVNQNCILYDELTEFNLDDSEANPYLFLFSRLRKTEDMPVPLRVRSASNPGNVGHAWVKKRFITDEATTHMMSNEDRTPRVFWNGERAFIPGLLADNPAINPDDYLPSLAHLPPITRARLLKGDWSVREDGLIQSDWPLRYRVGEDGLITVYDSEGREVTRWHESESYRFSTCDPAGTGQDKARSSRGHDHSWSVIQTWDKAPASSGPIIALRNNWRQRVAFTGLLDGLRQVHAEWSPSRMRIENEKLGCAAQELLRDELPIDTVPTGGKDKVSRASVLLQKLERGEVALPYAATWLEALEAEWYAWTGHPDETSDQVDAAAYAAMESQGRGYGMWGAELFGPSIWVEQFPMPTCVVVCVLPVDNEQLGEGLASAVVAVQVSGDGRFYADCFVGDVPPSQLLEQIRPLEQSTRGQIPLAIATTESMTTSVLDWVVGAYASATFSPQVFEVDPKLCANGTPEALTPFWLERLIRFRSGSAHARALINRAKAYPHTEDVAPLVSLGLAIETLSTIKGGA